MDKNKDYKEKYKMLENRTLFEDNNIAILCYSYYVVKRCLSIYN